MHYLSQTAVLSKEAASIIISNWLTLFTLHYITPMYDIWWLRQILVHFNNFKYLVCTGNVKSKLTHISRVGQI